MLMLLLVIVMPIEGVLALQIDNVQLQNFDDDSTGVGWETNEVTNATVFWGQGTLADQSLSSTVKGYRHYLDMSTLPNDNYSYVVQSCTDELCIQSERGEFTAGADQEPPFLDVEVASAVTEGRVDIIGSTEPFSEIRIIVNGEVQRRIANVGETGDIRFVGVVLSQAQNTVAVWAKDPAGNEYEQIFTVTVDDKAPEVSVNNFKPIVTGNELTLSGNVNEWVNMEFFVGLEEDNVAPLRVQGTSVTKLGQNVVDLKWDDVGADDLLHYAVYRDGRRIGLPTDPLFSDTTAASKINYAYRVSGVDRSCNEGGLSDTMNVQTPEGGNENPALPIELSHQCEEGAGGIEVNGAWSQTLTLQPGPNKITIIATDIAGNKFVFTNTTVYDSTPPVILTHNLGGLSPSYIKDLNYYRK